MKTTGYTVDLMAKDQRLGVIRSVKSQEGRTPGGELAFPWGRRKKLSMDQIRRETLRFGRRQNNDTDKRAENDNDEKVEEVKKKICGENPQKISLDEEESQGGGKDSFPNPEDRQQNVVQVQLHIDGPRPTGKTHGKVYQRKEKGEKPRPRKRRNAATRKNGLWQKNS